MSVLSRSIPMVALVGALSASTLTAQDPHLNENFRWYIGGQAGVMVFKTPTQSRGGVPMAGANMLIKARRTGLLLAVDEMIGKNETSSFESVAAAGGTESVSFNDVRRYSATLVAYPFRSVMQPYVGVGFGLMHVPNPQTQINSSGAERSYAARIGSSSFASLVGGLEFHVGGLRAFGQYQITTAPTYHSITGDDGTVVAAGRLLEGPTHTFSGGLRISLGSAREGYSGY